MIFNATGRVAVEYVAYKDGATEPFKRWAAAEIDPARQGIPDRVPLTDFEPGKYRLEIKLTDKGSNKTLTESLIFVGLGLVSTGRRAPAPDGMYWSRAFMVFGDVHSPSRAWPSFWRQPSVFAQPKDQARKLSNDEKKELTAISTMLELAAQTPAERPVADLGGQRPAEGAGQQGIRAVHGHASTRRSSPPSSCRLYWRVVSKDAPAA